MEGLKNINVKDYAATFYELETNKASLETNKASLDASPVTGIMVLKTSVLPLPCTW